MFGFGRKRRTVSHRNPLIALAASIDDGGHQTRGLHRQRLKGADAHRRDGQRRGQPLCEGDTDPQARKRSRAHCGPDPVQTIK